MAAVASSKSSKRRQHKKTPGGLLSTAISTFPTRDKDKSGDAQHTSQERNRHAHTHEMREQEGVKEVAASVQVERGGKNTLALDKLASCGRGIEKGGEPRGGPAPNPSES